MQTYKIKYNTKVYDFRRHVTSTIGSEWGRLEDLHKELKYEVFERSKDQSTVWHKNYYERFQKNLYPLYEQFIIEVIKPHFNLPEIIYQKIPTFRTHLVNNLGVGEFHKDKTYNHGITEINCWLPFTDAYDTNTIWLESKEDEGDYEPQIVKYGEVLIFDGANLMHGNKINDTINTRVSMDFRIVDPEKFIPNEAGSINTGTQFKLGGYFGFL